MGNSLNTAGRRVETLLTSTSKKLSSVVISGTSAPLALNLAPRAAATEEEEGFECPICFLVRIQNSNNEPLISVDYLLLILFCAIFLILSSDSLIILIPSFFGCRTIFR